jgi:hypothetical protein
LGTLTAARLPFDPAARIVALVQVTRPKRTVKRPRASATADLRRGPTETVTRSLGSKPRPATRSGFMVMIVSAGRLVSADGVAWVASDPRTTTATSRPINNTLEKSRLSRVRRAAVFLVVLLVGCGVRGDGKTIDEARADELVLHPADVGAAFDRVRNLGGRRAAEARYQQADSAGRADPLTIDSRASVFPSTRAAEHDLDAARSTIDKGRGWQPISEPGLGDESFAATVVSGVMRYFRVFWRTDNATASLRVKGFEALSLEDVLELARKQQRRIARAAS